jgi:uncharacterized protein YegL
MKDNYSNKKEKKSRSPGLIHFLVATTMTGIMAGIVVFQSSNQNAPSINNNAPPDYQKAPSINNNAPPDYQNAPSINNNAYENYVPLSNNTQPLPHDGLFIRRNNEFGTKLSLGIKELIEQGVLIDQNKIRFDDFVSISSEQVPLPQSDSSLSINYGLTKIPKSLKRDNRATHYLAIALKSADKAPSDYKAQTLPVNYVFVIDSSGSMEGEKVDAVKIAIRELITNMRKDDVIGIITFDDQTNTLLKATPIQQIKINEFSQMLSSVVAGGGTDLNLGLLFGIDEISRYGNGDRLNRIYLFSDGNPTSGETDWIKIRQNIASKTRGNINLSAFAFGSDANTRELNALAGSASGSYAFVTDPSSIELNLRDELDRREYLSAINVQINVEIDPAVSIMHLYGHDQITDPISRAEVLKRVKAAEIEAEVQVGVESAPDIITNDKGIRIFVPNLAVGETYWIVFELSIPDDKASVGQVALQYVNTFAKRNEQNKLELSAPGNLPNDLVVRQSLGLWTSEVAFYALDDLYQQDLATAEARIQNHISQLDAANTSLSSAMIADDIVTLRKFVSLAQNLGKPRNYSDNTFKDSETIFINGLSTFGRVRNGFIPTTATSSPYRR